MRDVLSKWWVVVGLLGCGTAHAVSTTGIGFPHFTAVGPQDSAGRGMSSMIETDAVDFVGRSEYRDCALAVVEVKRFADAMKELELQKSKNFDPATRVVPNFIERRFVVNGHAVTTDKALSIKMTLTDTRSGRVISTFEGSTELDIDKMIKLNQAALKQFVEAICRPAYRLQVSVGPHFQIDAQVCGIDQPFEARPKGKFAGVKVSFKPASDRAGSFTESGSAYGAQWSGSGAYTIAWNGDTGAFRSTNPNTAQVAGHTVQNEDTMVGTVTKLPGRCRADDGAPPKVRR